jgi:hypothetical protein
MNTRAPHHRKTPVRYNDPEYTAFRREIQLHPFPGEPAKYSGSFLLPDLVVKQSGIANAGWGLFLLEDVYPSQIITMYSKIIISEKRAKILKENVFPHSHALFNPLQKIKHLLASFYKLYINIGILEIDWNQ